MSNNRRGGSPGHSSGNDPWHGQGDNQGNGRPPAGRPPQSGGAGQQPPRPGGGSGYGQQPGQPGQPGYGQRRYGAGQGSQPGQPGGQQPGQSGYGSGYGRSRPGGQGQGGQPGQPGQSGQLGPRTSGVYGAQGAPGAGGATGGRAARRRAAAGKTPPGGAPTAGRRGGRAPAGKLKFIDYPRHGKTGWQRWVPSWKLTGAVAGGGAALGLLSFAVAYAMIGPKKLDTKPQQVTVAYNDGKTMFTSGSKRIAVDPKQLPETITLPAIAAENPDFWTDNGVSFFGTFRAVINTYVFGNQQGGSTITQQLIKNNGGGAQQTPTRKLTEFVRAMKLTNTSETPDASGLTLTKAEILAGYLNTNPYGRRAVGISAAAQQYFRTPYEKLNYQQGAVLAVLMRGPGRYDPYFDGDVFQKTRVNGENDRRLKEYYGIVLDRMLDVDDPHFKSKVTKADVDKWKQTLPDIAPPDLSLNEMSGQQGYIDAMVTKELKNRYKLSEQDIAKGGFTVVTTIDQKIQTYAEETAEKEFWGKGGPTSRRFWIPEDVGMAMSAVESKTGEIKMVYGGRDYKTQPYNVATGANGPQVGSTFKAFALVAALNEGKDLSTRYNGGPCMMLRGEAGRVCNEGEDGRSEKDSEPVDLVEATKNSVNTAFVDLTQDIGMSKVAHVLTESGIKEEDIKKNRDNRIALGTASPSLIDLTNAYATISAVGQRGTPHIVKDVQGLPDLVKPEELKPQSAQDIKDEAWQDAIYALRRTAEEGSAKRAYSRVRVQMGAKTGTSQNDRSAQLLGFTKDLAVGVKLFTDLRDENGKYVGLYGVGGPKQSKRGQGHGNRVGGGSLPSIIWGEFMAKVVRDKRPGRLPEPANKYNPKPEPSASPSPGATCGITGDMPCDPKPAETCGPDRDKKCKEVKCRKDDDLDKDGYRDRDFQPCKKKNGDPGDCDPLDLDCHKPKPGETCGPDRNKPCPYKPEDPGGEDGTGQRYAALAYPPVRPERPY